MNRRQFLGRSSSAFAISSLSACQVRTDQGVFARHLEFASYTGGSVTLTRRDIEALERSLTGDILTETNLNFDQARRIWNACIERRPTLIVRPRTPEDIAQTVKFSAQHGVLLSVRGGGHNHHGYAVADKGIMIDLSSFKGASLQPETRSIVAQTGMTWGDFDQITHQADLATTGAIVSMVGLPGYTLGGGIGWLHRKFGAGCDNLIGANLVLANGETVRVDERENEDLLWALRGGGGNFGIATDLEFRLHRLREVYAGLIFYPLESLERVGQFLDDYLTDAPDDLNVWMLHRKAPPTPLIPERFHGQSVLILAVTWTGDEAGALRVTRPLLEIAPNIGSSLSWKPYPDWQSSLDGAWGDGFCNEWVGGYLSSYSDDVRDTIATYVNDASSPLSDVKVARLGGEFSRMGPSDTSFGFRGAKYAYVIQTRWRKDEPNLPHLAWTQSFQKALSAFSGDEVYVNFIGRHERSQSVKNAYETVAFERLSALKRRVDPNNFFRQTANIPG